MLNKLKATDFQPYLNEVFRIHLNETEYIDLELTNITELGSEPEPGVRGPFGLIFLGPIGTQYLKQHTYHFKNEKMGEFDFFIVPLGLETGRMRYEAVFT